MKILGIIPARYASTRLPAKALAEIKGKSMIQRVYEQASKASALSEVLVATDDERIFKHVTEFGGKVIMTDVGHTSGTDRCYEAYTSYKTPADFVINIQGDEPFIKPEQINLLAEGLREETQLATLVKKIDNFDTLFNPNTPKVVFNHQQEALYFSRQPIPYVRSAMENSWLNKHLFYKHIGIYAYRTDILKEVTSLPPSSLEKAESLEQLRWIENGYTIHVMVTEYESQGIDTPEDLENARGLY